MKQKTIKHFDIYELDLLVNTFKGLHKIKATQSYCGVEEGTLYHYRVLFYEE